MIPTHDTAILIIIISYVTYVLENISMKKQAGDRVGGAFTVKPFHNKLRMIKWPRDAAYSSRAGLHYWAWGHLSDELKANWLKRASLMLRPS